MAFCLNLLLIWLVSGSSASGDGGLVRLDATIGGYQVVALSSPTPLVEGELDLTVLLTTIKAGTRATDAEVYVAIVPVDVQKPADDVWVSLASSQQEHPGGVGAFFQVWPGEWMVYLKVRGPEGEGEREFSIVVGERSQWRDIWPWLLPLVAVIALWLLREWARSDSPRGSG